MGKVYKKDKKDKKDKYLESSSSKEKHSNESKDHYKKRRSRERKASSEKRDRQVDRDIRKEKYRSQSKKHSHDRPSFFYDNGKQAATRNRSRSPDRATRHYSKAEHHKKHKRRSISKEYRSTRRSEKMRSDERTKSRQRDHDSRRKEFIEDDKKYLLQKKEEREGKDSRRREKYQSPLVRSRESRNLEKPCAAKLSTPALEKFNRSISHSTITSSESIQSYESNFIVSLSASNRLHSTILENLESSKRCPSLKRSSKILEHHRDRVVSRSPSRSGCHFESTRPKSPSCISKINSQSNGRRSRSPKQCSSKSSFMRSRSKTRGTHLRFQQRSIDKSRGSPSSPKPSGSRSRARHYRSRSKSPLRAAYSQRKYRSRSRSPLRSKSPNRRSGRYQRRYRYFSSDSSSSSDASIMIPNHRRQRDRLIRHMPGSNSGAARRMSYSRNSLKKDEKSRLSYQCGVDGASIYDDWASYINAEGNTYFYNQRTGISQWKTPEGFDIRHPCSRVYRYDKVAKIFTIMKRSPKATGFESGTKNKTADIQSPDLAEDRGEDTRAAGESVGEEEVALDPNEIINRKYDELTERFKGRVATVCVNLKSSLNFLNDKEDDEDEDFISGNPIDKRICNILEQQPLHSAPAMPAEALHNDKEDHFFNFRRSFIKTDNPNSSVFHELYRKGGVFNSTGAWQSSMYEYEAQNEAYKVSCLKTEYRLAVHAYDMVTANFENFCKALNHQMEKLDKNLKDIRQAIQDVQLLPALQFLPRQPSF